MCQRTVLIVEDEVLIRLTLADALVDAGYQIIEAGSCLEAVAVLGQYEVDAVVTDIDMPGALNGLDLARMVTTKRNVAVIVASGGHCLSGRDLPDGARFVSKPYRFEAIAGMLSEMTSGEGLRLAS